MNWADKIAIFEMAYPGTNWRKLSYAVFDARLKSARYAKRYLENNFDLSQATEAMADQDNRIAMVKRRFRFFYPKG